MRLVRTSEIKSARKDFVVHLIKCLLVSLSLFSTLSVSSQAPVANFTANITSGCSPVNVQFTDQSSGNPVFWNWDLGNGQLSTQQNPAASYTTPGTYTITLVVRNANGIHSVTKQDFIVVNPSPSAAFSANIRTACIPATIQFTDQSVPNSGTITAWEWDFGDGTKSTLQNPTKTYSQVGFYTVYLTVTSSTGCRNTQGIGNYIRVVSGVTADFSSTEPGTCQPPYNVSFTDLTSGPGNITFQWDFGNSTTSTQQSPVATYAAPGTYTVRLTATSEFGCSGTVQRDVTINGVNTAFTAPDTVCLNSVVNFQNASSPAPLTSVWDFGNGTGSTNANDTTSYTAPGTYTVRLINTYNNCSDSVIRNIVVPPNPTVDFTAANTISCRAPFTVNFSDISPNAVSWQWNFGDGGTSTQQNPTHQYNAEGEYTVTLTITDSRGCRNTVSKSTFVRIIKPTLSISNAPAGGCVGFNYSPVAVVNAIDGVASYFWNFGDGFTSTAPNPSHVYGAVGTYRVSLVITTTGGCVDSVVYATGVRIGTSPNTNFTAAPLDVCPMDTVQFMVDPATTADVFAWEFGDGGTSGLQNPQHFYSDSGYFTVRLTAYNNGCPQTATRNLYIHVKPPIARFISAVNCNNRRFVSFTNTSKTDAGYGPITYSWDFGDGNTSTAINPTHTYATIGTYTTRLIVYNGSCSHEYSQPIVLNTDVADFTVSKATVCKNEVFSLNAINSNQANIVSYEWSFDGAPFVNMGPNITYSFATTGPHNIALLITDVNGCRDTLVRNGVVTVMGPIAQFTPNITGGCVNSLVTFNDASTPSGTSNIVQWRFDFGDGHTQSFNSAPYTHTYGDTGSFVVRLTVTDASGCQDTYVSTDTITITKPVTRFSAARTLICPGASLQFSDSSSGKGLNWLWNFGDGNTSTQQNPSHVYAGRDSVYTVKLVITDTVGCSDSLTMVNYITTKVPKPAFDIKDTSSICPPLETKFTFRGTDYESFFWDFGDGSTSTLTNPNHFYNTYGNFVPKLYVIGFGGCMDSASAQVNVYDVTTSASFVYAPTAACNSLLVDFTITTPPSTKFTFYSGDGSFDTSQRKTFTHFYRTFGYYSPSIYIEDSSKCLVGLGGAQQIRILGAEPLFGLDKKAFCDTGSVLFANYTIGNDPVVSSVWDFGDGNTSTVTDPSHTYTTPGTFYPSLTVTTQTGCTKTLNDTVRVYATPQPSIQADTVVCVNEQLLLQGILARPDTAINFTWTFGNGSSSAAQNPSTTYGSAGNYTITLEAANKLGCKTNTTARVMVPPNPTITMGDDPVIPVGTGINLPVTYGPNIVTYNWIPAGSLSCSNCAVPFANPKSTTRYRVNVTDIYGCTNSNEVTVVVVCNDKNYFIPNTFSPNGDGNNDVFYPRGTGLTRVQSLRIFNRWGELVFERKNFTANDASMGWNGMYKGKKAETDTYVYAIEFICDNALIVPFKGNVTLLR
jgi:gliding motility-associated-like protein